MVRSPADINFSEICTINEKFVDFAGKDSLRSYQFYSVPTRMFPVQMGDSRYLDENESLINTKLGVWAAVNTVMVSAKSWLWWCGRNMAMALLVAVPSMVVVARRLLQWRRCVLCFRSFFRWHYLNMQCLGGYSEGECNVNRYRHCRWRR